MLATHANHQSLKKYEEATANYEKALSLLPQTNLTPTEKKQKANYADQIYRCKHYGSGAQFHIGTQKGLKKTPRILAAAMIKELTETANYNSSVSLRITSTK